VVTDNSAGKVTKQPDGPSKGQLSFDSFSVTMGAYLKTFAKSPKNPCLEEFDFAVAYFETLICQAEGKIEEAEAALDQAKSLIQRILGKKSMPKVDELLQ
jgi:tetratricopeptide (TPR) repeat protein